MNENDERKRMHGIAMLALLSIGVYLFPIMTITSLYAQRVIPFILFGLFVVTGWFVQWLQHRFTGLMERSSFVRSAAALVIGTWFAIIPGMLLHLSLPVIITLAACSITASFTGFQYDHSYHSTMLWRLQIMGVISAIVLTIAAGQVQFLWPMQMYTMYMYAAGVISFVLWIVAQYRTQLDRAVLNDGSRRLVLREFTRANHQRIIWMLVVIVGIGAFPSLAAWLAPLRDRVLAWIRSLLGTSSPQQLPDTPQTPNEPMTLPDELKGPPSEPSMFWEILSWVVFGAAAAVMIWLLAKLARVIWNKLEERFKGMLQPAQKREAPKTEYVDISELLEVPTQVRKRWFRKKESVPAQCGERIRYYYRTWVNQALQRGVGIEKSHTPLEAAETIIKSGSKSSDRNSGFKSSDIKSSSKPLAAKSHFKPGEQELAARLPAAYNAVRYGRNGEDYPDVIEMDRIWKSYSK
ncbi:hypothetical protein KQI74_25720 [Paenibacillus barcinonensis]|uniref:hypothetical protein n=1 Tax=Paenibacillus barcinonensis TaxID=198119 RepID=UPI001C0F5366|nr:hypothetical protein [Paenibacillus barcinonensis]MBU5355657.1 hypothetical protein [Paenibacillus barcinonensis]